jgi:zinc-binding alcohol dehydrogenase/oxidoreductase
MLAQHVVLTVEVRQESGALRLAADVTGGNESISLQPSRVVARHEQAVVALAELPGVGLEPVEEGNVRLGVFRQPVAVPALLDAAIPGTNVLANVAAVDLRAEVFAVGLWNGSRRLRPVGEAACRVERSRLVERASWTRINAQAAVATVQSERWRRPELDVGDDRAENDPRSVPARDQHRVLAVEADTAPRGGLTVDMLVRVDEDPVRAAELPAEVLQLAAQLRVGVVPRVARQATVSVGPLGLGPVVTERSGDHRARAREQRLRMARMLRLRHGELHVGKESARAALANVPLCLLVRDGGRCPDGVESKRLSEPFEIGGRHTDSLPLVLAVRIHEDGGPDVLVLEEVPDPSPAAGEVLIRLRASALNHLDVWIRKGLPSVPKPRILGADGSGVVESLGERVTGFEPGQPVVINPGVEAADGAIHVIGEHGDGTNAQLIAVPATNVYPIPDGLTFEEAAAFPLVFETAYRMLVTRARLQSNEWVLLWGIGSGVSTAGLAIAKALGARTIVTSSSDEKLARARELGADATVNHATSDVKAAVKDATAGHGADIVIDHVGEATWRTSLDVAAREGRIAVCGATSGPNPPAALHRVWWKQLTILGSTMGTKADFEGAYDLVATGRARPVVDEIVPLAEIRAAHERLEAGEQLGKIVLAIPA